MDKPLQLKTFRTVGTDCENIIFIFWRQTIKLYPMSLKPQFVHKMFLKVMKLYLNVNICQWEKKTTLILHNLFLFESRIDMCISCIIAGFVVSIYLELIPIFAHKALLQSPRRHVTLFLTKHRKCPFLQC